MTIFSKRAVLISVLCLLAAAVAVVGAKVRPYDGSHHRKHYVVERPAGTMAFEVTVITQLDGATDGAVFLIRNANGEKLQVTRTLDFSKAVVRHEFEDTDSQAKVLAITKFPVAGGTRQMVKEQLRNAKDSDFGYEVHSRGRSVAFKWPDLADRGKQAAVRKQMRPHVNSSLLGKLDEFREVLALPMFFETCTTMTTLLEGEACPRETGLRFALVEADCTFDASFGVPCSPDQKDFILDSRRAGKPSKVY